MNAQFLMFLRVLLELMMNATGCQPVGTQCPLGVIGLGGALTNGSGIVKSTLCVGKGPSSFIVPSGATQLQLGTNDNQYSNNSGSFTVNVVKNAGSPSSVIVGGKAMPWNPSTNAAFDFGLNDGDPSVIALTGLAAGDVVTITYVSGTVSAGGASGDADGYLTVPPGAAGNGGPTGSFSNGFGSFPTKYMTAVLAISSTSWGTILGTLSDQTDLQAALDAKAASSSITTINSVPCALNGSCTIPTSSGNPNGRVITTSTTAACGEYLRSDASGAITVTLPAVTTGCTVVVQRNGAGVVTIDPNGATYDGVTTQLVQGTQTYIWTDGTGYHSTSPVVPGAHCSLTTGVTNIFDCSGSGTTISALTYTATDSTIVAAWTTSSAADSNLFCGGKPAIDNGFQQGLTTGHLAIVTGLNASSSYSCYVTSAGTVSSVSSVSTSAGATRTAIRNGSLGSVTAWAGSPIGDNFYNVVSSDGLTYLVSDDTNMASTNSNQGIFKFTNESTMAVASINAMSGFGASGGFTGTDGPGKTAMGNKLWGLWSQSGILCAWEGRLSAAVWPQSAWFPWLMCDHADHGATWNTYRAPATYTSTGTEIQGAGMFPFPAMGTVSFVGYAADDGTVGYNTSGNGIDGANGWVYMNFNDGWWNGGSYLFLMRVPRVYLTSQASYTRYQFWKGPQNPTPGDFINDDNWSSSFYAKQPILEGFGQIGAVSETFVPGFNYYLLNVSTAGGYPTGLPTGNVLATYAAPTPAGPFTQIYTASFPTSGQNYYDHEFLARSIQANSSSSTLTAPLLFTSQNTGTAYFANFTMSSGTALSEVSFCGGGLAGTSGNTFSIASNSSCSGSMDVTSGNSLLVGILADTPIGGYTTATKVFDTAGNTFLPVSLPLNPPIGSLHAAWYLCNNCNGIVGDVISATAQFAYTSPFSAIGVWQIASGGPVQVDGNIKTATASGTNVAVSSFNTSYANEFCAAFGTRNGTNLVGAAGTGFTLSSASIWGAQYTAEHVVFTSTQTGFAPNMTWGSSGTLAIWEACVGY
jgi:hypothetical protein